MKCATKAEMLRCDMFAAWIVKGSVNTGQQGVRRIACSSMA